MKSLAVCSLLALLAAPSLALEPYLVHDINPMPEPDDSDPEYLVRLGDAVLFFAEDQDRGRELWRSDGTAGGTYPLSDMCDADLICYGNPLPFRITERFYFFLAPGTLESYQSLWVSDGTPGGTFRLTEPDVNPYPPMRLWSESQGIFYFAARDFEHGRELWRSDGTPAGTWLVADVRPGPDSSGITWLSEYRGRIWFGADDGQRGGALWSTDGTPGGTVLALDPVPSSAAHPAPEIIRVLGNRLTFFAPAPGGGQQLWAGDGTAKRTAPVTKLKGGKTPAILHDSVVRGNRLYFVAEDKQGQELWVSDGTARGTRVLTAFRKRDAFFSFGGDYLLYLPFQGGVKDRFIFWAHDGAHGIELWISDGTQKGTRLLRDVCPGPCSGARNLWYELNGRLYFTAEEPAHGYELWSTDGTEAGTRIALDLCPGSCSSYPFAPFLLGSRILFMAGDGQTGDEIWSTDGTAAGTTRVSDFEEDSVVWNFFEGEILDGQLLFSARETLYGNELWRTDGTPAGTQLVKDINASDLGGSFPTGLHAFGDSAVFLADDGVHGFELWRSHGPGASLIGDFTPGAEPRHASGLAAEAAGDDFYFLSSGLWRTDGTEAGTLQLLGFETQPCCLRAVGGSVFFIAEDESDFKGIWTSDGTVAGTRMLTRISSDTTSHDLFAFQGKLYFFATNSPADLWVSDGTEAGTVQVKSLGSKGSLPTVHAGRLWFFARDDEHGIELWSSDGTEAGTAMAVDLAPGPASFQANIMASFDTALIISGSMGLWTTDGTQEGTRNISSTQADIGRWGVFHGKLFFSVYGGFGVSHLWASDGTEAGTGLFHDRDGQPIPSPRAFAVLGDRLLFVSEGSLYQSDGTEAGTFRIRDRVSEELVRAGERVFFGGFDDATGWELWAVRP